MGLPGVDARAKGANMGAGLGLCAVRMNSAEGAMRLSRLRRRMNMKTATSARRAITPPITPPTIAPVSVE